MSKISGVLIALLLIVQIHVVLATETSELPSAQVKGSVWTLRQALAYALEHNPDAEAARQRIWQARAALQEANASLYPQLSVSGGYTRTNNPMHSFGNILNQGQFSESIDFNKPGTTDSLFGQIMLRYPLYNGGRDQASRLAAGKQNEAVEQQARVTREQLSFEVIRAYHSILQAKGTVTARDIALASLQTALDRAKARFQEGTLLKEEVLMLEAEQAAAEETLLQARHSERLARLGLALLLGKEPETVRLAESDPAKRTDLPIPAASTSLQRPELAAMDLMLAAQRALIRQAQAARYPSAEVFGSYQVEQGTTMDEGSGDSWAAGLRLNQTLFDGKASQAAIAREEARLAELLAQQRKLQLSLAMEVEEARLRLTQETEKLAVAERRLQSSSESVRLTRLRFQEGLSTTTELIDAEKRLAEATSGHAQTNHARHIAVAQLRYSYGLPLLDSE
ncbi:MAG: TolC family protein [Desulfobulbaceae bacterium]|nr:TolC family protein [Desulfobulbaceae bacterium]